MAVYTSMKWLLSLYLFSCLLSISNGAGANSSVKYKAVNLGGWLVIEGWMKPSLFDRIINNDLLDGTRVQFRSVSNGKYLSAENGGGTTIVANRGNPARWETFTLWRITEKTFNLRVFNGQFIGVDKQRVETAATSNSPGTSETFEIVRKPGDPKRVRIKASNGSFLQVKTESSVTAAYGSNSSWADDDPSVFEIKIIWQLRGEYQLTNGYGPEKATQVLGEHWSGYIVDEDFKFISEHGLNAVRIPVGWWIASDPTPPKPFVGGSLETLDKAFSWAEKYGLSVILDLHAAPGSQNGNEHSATRDGSLEWGKAADTIQQTVDVIDFLSARYAKSSSLAAVELINEPHAPDVSLETLSKYYRAGYEAVRKHSNAYVIMSNRLGPVQDHKELFPLASGLMGSVIDVHCYNLFDDATFKGKTAQQNIDYIYNDRSSQLKSLTTSNGPPIFVGEWTAAWEVKEASKEEYQRFARAQMEVYGRGFGWAYWSLNDVDRDWSLKQMINEGYITI